MQQIIKKDGERDHKKGPKRDNKRREKGGSREDGEEEERVERRVNDKEICLGRGGPLKGFPSWRREVGGERRGGKSRVSKKN